MAMEVSDVDRRVESMADERADRTNPRIIIDASYIRGMKADGAPLRAISEQGGRIVITDTLAYELLTSDHSKWSAARHRLASCRDAIEVWEHVSEMCRVELEENRPYGDPLHSGKTERLRLELAKEPHDMDERIIEDWNQEREDSLELLRTLAASQPSFREDLKRIKNKDPHDKEVMQICYDLVNDPENIQLVLKDVVQNPNKVDCNWILWHLSKSLLALYCDSECRGKDKFKNISNKKLANIKHDSDYLILLAFADAIASRETTGEQSYYRRWMFGDAVKPLIRYYEKEQIVHKFRQMSKVSIYVTKQLDGYTCALDSWSRGVLKKQDWEVLPASVFISYKTKRGLEFFCGPAWKHTVEILTGYSATELQEFGGVVFVDPRTLDTLFDPSAQYA